MTPELEQHIREKYPLIFSQRCEMSIGDGWFDIIDALCANIQGHIDNVARQRRWAIEWNDQVNDPFNDWSDKSPLVKREEREVPELVEQVVATQIKEKFGTLRFYYQGGDNYIRGLESMADSMSARICEDCGKPGKKTTGGWIRTLCEEHAHEKEVQDELRSRSIRG
jgi:hypothetical protein